MEQKRGNNIKIKIKGNHRAQNPTCNVKIETCRVFGSSKMFFFPFYRRSDGARHTHTKICAVFQTLIHVIASKRRREKKTAHTNSQLYSLHGFQKQKFIRFMHSGGECYINELQFRISAHFGFSIASFANSFCSSEEQTILSFLFQFNL